MYSLVTIIAIRHGAVVDGLSIEKGRVFYSYGFCSANEHCGKNRVTLVGDEIVQSITYGRSTFGPYLDFICNLSFQTNKRVLGPFATWKCSEPIYRVDIPSDMMLVDFFNQDLKTKLSWTEAGTDEPFIDGFNSEYTTTKT